jgi:micrococcal nuclease
LSERSEDPAPARAIIPLFHHSIIPIKHAWVFMRKYMILVCLAASFFLCVSHQPYAETYYQVKWVIDGDTIVLGDGRKVRYIGINAPEIEHDEQKAEPFGNQAKAFNQGLAYRKKIRLEFDRQRYDRYGRLLAYVFLQDGSFVNVELLAHGCGFYLYQAPNLKYDSELLAAQRYAMSQKRGIWQKWKEPKTKYVGNQKSKRFHLPTCPLAKAISVRNQVMFATKWDAFWNGYAPAKKCIKEVLSSEVRGSEAQ